MTELPDDWRGYFAERGEDGGIKGLHRCRQEGYAEEPLDEDDPEVVAYKARPDEVLSPAATTPTASDLRTRLDAIKAEIDALEEREGKTPATPAQGKKTERTPQ